MKAWRNRRLTLFGMTACAASLCADDPIFNMMPRWSGGWGFQLLQEYRHESDLLENGGVRYKGFSEDVHLLHLEGVYTWHRSVRLTAKLPYVLDARREMPDGLGGKRIEHDNGIGDLTLGLPLKSYFNRDGSSGAWTIKPLLRMPLVGDDDYEIYDNEWGHGLGVGYHVETSNWHFEAGLSGWVYHNNEPVESFASFDIGHNFEALGSNGTLLWETDFHWEDDESRTLKAGPALYWNVNDTMHFKIEWKHDFFDRQGPLDHGNGNTFLFGIGFVW